MDTFQLGFMVEAKELEEADFRLMGRHRMELPETKDPYIEESEGRFATIVTNRHGPLHLAATPRLDRSLSISGRSPKGFRIQLGDAGSFPSQLAALTPFEGTIIGCQTASTNLAHDSFYCVRVMRPP
jgi:hypothetical protein